MALRIGELIGMIRADDSGWRSGLESARLRMRGLQRDSEGRLRDLRGRFISEGEAAGRGLSAGIRAHAEIAAGALRKVAPALVGIGAGVPAAAAATAALGGLAAGAAAAGLAVKAFQLAVKPQMEAVANVADLAAKAEEAAAEGGEKAAEAQKAYKDALADLPPATQATAKAFIGLKKDFKDWSDSLSGTTMPLFTRGIGILRDLLPTLTPFVKAAAGAIGGMLDRVATGVKSAGFKQWAADMSAAAGPALANFLTVIGNLGRGFAGLLQAFLPASAGVTGGLVKMSDAFADWATSLHGSEGFARFLELARNGGGVLGNLASAAVNLLVALSPLLGTTAMLANALARMINAVPVPVLTALAAVIAGVSIGMKVYAASTVVAAAATRAWGLAVRAAGAAQAFATWIAAAGRWVATMTVTVARTVAGWATMAAGAVANAARTVAAWTVMGARAAAGAAMQLAAGARVVAGWVLMGVQSMIHAARMAAAWVVAMGPVGWVIAAVVALVALVIANWDRIKSATVAVWQWIWNKIKAVATGIRNAVILAAVAIYNTWIRINNAIRNAAGAAWNWIRSKISSAINAAKSAVVSAITRIGNALNSIHARVRGALAGAGRWLVSAGRSIIQGLINGIRNMAGAVGNAVKGVLQKARNLLPFSPAKEGPFSGKGWTLYSGQSMMTGLAQGIGQRQGLVTDAMTRAAQAASAAIPGPMVGQPATSPAGPGMPGAAGRGGVLGRVKVDVDVTGGEDDLIRLIGNWVRKNARGDVQLALSG